MRKPVFAYAKTKTQISYAVTAKLISAFVFATWIVLSLFYLNLKFQASNRILWLYSLVCVGPGRKPRRPVFSQRDSYIYAKTKPQINCATDQCLCFCSTTTTIPPKFQASSHSYGCTARFVCDLVRNPKDRFSDNSH